MESQHQKHVEQLLGAQSEDHINIDKAGNSAAFKNHDQQAFAPYPSTPYDVENLPLVVWLRGDEPFFEQFAYDADQAMSELGIKRSRLTQISGKELRVGRVRMGRYIKPVFRLQDINEYKAWTRPTASHRKSSSMIDEAIDVLKTKTEDYQAVLEKTDFHHELKFYFDKHSSDIFKHITQLQRQNDHLQGSLNEARAAFNTRIQGLPLADILLTIKELAQQNKDLQSKLSQMLATQEKSSTLLSETLAIIKFQNELQQNSAKDTNARLDTLQTQMTAMQEQQKEQFARVSLSKMSSSNLSQADKRRIRASCRLSDSQLAAPKLAVSRLRHGRRRATRNGKR